MKGTISTGVFNIDFNEQYSEHFNKGYFNWLSFNWIKVSTEFDRRFGVFEIELYLLGLGVRLYWIYDGKRNKEEFERLVTEIDDNYE